jgi:hypothetical protein
MGPQLPPLSPSQLETLLACLDPQLEGFGGADCWLADARAYLQRLNGDSLENPSVAALHVWLDAWDQAEGNRETLRLALQVLQQQQGSGT